MQVDSVEEVDRLMRAAGARVTREPVDAEFFTGRSAYLCDEGNYFEIVWADIPNNPVPHLDGRPDRNRKPIALR